MCVIEVRAMIDGSLCAGGAAEDGGLPCVQMAVEVDHGDGAVGAVDAAQEGKRDGMVATEGDDTREGATGFTRAGEVRVRAGSAGEEGIVALLDLLDGVSVVVTGSVSDGYR